MEKNPSGARRIKVPNKKLKSFARKKLAEVEYYHDPSPPDYMQSSPLNQEEHPIIDWS